MDIESDRPIDRIGLVPAVLATAHTRKFHPALSARSSPAGYLHTPASSVSSASPTPPQALTVSENDRLRNIIIPTRCLSDPEGGTYS
jgi:hypothetical protein